jgi:hypothetical protein
MVPPPPPPLDGTGSSGTRTFGWVLVGAGVVSLAGGVGFWALRGSLESRLDGECGPDQAHCPASATDDIANGRMYTGLGVGLFALAGVCVASGVALVLVGGPRAPASAALVPAPGGAGVAGVF